MPLNVDSHGCRLDGTQGRNQRAEARGVLIAMKEIPVLGHGVEQHDHTQDTHLSRLSLVHPRTTCSWFSSTGERRLLLKLGLSFFLFGLINNGA